MIRETLLKILTEFESAKKNDKFKGHPLANYIRKDARENFKKVLGDEAKDYIIDSSPGKGNWVNTPWINLMDDRVTTTAEDGYYPVYLFSEDQKTIVLELGQGEYQPRKLYKKDTESVLISRAAIIRSKVPNHIVRFKSDISKTNLKKGDDVKKRWISSGAFGKIYRIDKFPTEEELVKDLKEITKLYQIIISKGGYLEGKFKTENTWLEDIEIALKNLGGIAHLSEIFDEVKSIRKKLSPTWTRSIQKELERHSSDSKVWNSKHRGKKDLFYSVEGIGEGVWGLRDQMGIDDEIKNSNLSYELKKKYKTHRSLERESRKFINMVKKQKGYKCEACGLKFKKIYGHYDQKPEDYVEAHHIVPLHKVKDDTKIQTIDDLAALCANCHKMIHKYGCPSIEEFKEKIKKDYINTIQKLQD